MERFFTPLVIFAASISAAHAGGLDRSFQSVSPLFSDSGSVSLSFGTVNPSVTGTDGSNAYDVGQSYQQMALSYTRDVSDSFTIGLIYDQPFGANTLYNGSPATSTLGGTGADLASNAASVYGKYQLNNRLSVFAGLRAQSVQADVTLNGTAYAGAIATSAVAATTPGLTATLLGAALNGDTAAQTSIDTTYGAGTFATLAGSVGTTSTNFLAAGGYSASIADDLGLGYSVGAAYEIPEIALRAVLTYHSEIDHSASTTEMLLGSTVNSSVNYVTPQSVNLEFQTGIAENTLLTASARWSEFSAVDVIPTALGQDLVNLDDSYRYTLGVARRFSDAFAGSVTLSYEPEGGGATVSPLGPTDGMMGITVGGRYTHDNIVVSGGINYSMLGDANAGVAGQSAASFTDNSVIGVGFKVEIMLGG